MKKVGNTSFREEAIKKMSLKDFKNTYKDILKGQDLDAVYADITGKQKAQAATKEEPTEDGDVG